MTGVNWTVISLLVGFAMAWSGVLLWSVRAMNLNAQKHIDHLFKNLEAKIDTQDKRIAKVDRDLLELRAELPRQYVMREDWIRGSQVIDAKLETLNEKMNRLLERGAKTQ